jgi:hypothetical protein
MHIYIAFFYIRIKSYYKYNCKMYKGKINVIYICVFSTYFIFIFHFKFNIIYQLSISKPNNARLYIIFWVIFVVVVVLDRY